MRGKRVPTDSISFQFTYHAEMGLLQIANYTTIPRRSAPPKPSARTKVPTCSSHTARTAWKWSATITPLYQSGWEHSMIANAVLGFGRMANRWKAILSGAHKESVGIMRAWVQEMEDCTTLRVIASMCSCVRKVRRTDKAGYRNYFVFHHFDFKNPCVRVFF